MVAILKLQHVADPHIRNVIAIYPLQRRGRFLKRPPANPELCSSIKGGVVTFEKY